MDTIHLIVDGSNIAYFKRNTRGRPQFSNIEVMRKYLEQLKTAYSIKYEILIDATLGYRIDDWNRLEQEYKAGNILKCPQGLKADEFIIQYFNAHPENTYIISNDNFKEYTLFGANTLTFCKFAILFDTVIIPNFNQLFQTNVMENQEGVGSNGLI